METILITGHCGFVGTHLIEYLKKFENFKLIRYDLEEGDDIRDIFKVNEIFRKNDINTVIHLAARAGVRESKDFPEEYITTNIVGTQNVISSAEKYNVKKFIFFSSSSVLGEQPSPNSEEDAIKPTSLYGVSKATGEMLLEMSDIKSRIVIRPFTIYGENGRADQVIYKWIRQIQTNQPITFYGDGSSKRGYIYIDDLLKGVELLLNRDDRNFEIFNLGGNEVISLSMLLEIFKKEVSNLTVKQLPRSSDDPLENWADINKAKNTLGWLPTSNFEENVKRIIQKELKCIKS